MTDEHHNSVSEPQGEWLKKMADTGNSFLEKAYALSSPSEARDLYDRWANSYDRDLDELDYAFPANAASALVNAMGTDDISDLRILDAGCGTGLVGAILASEYNATNVDGLDISPGMLAIAQRTHAYKVLTEADLTKRIARQDGEYDAVICVGTLTKGHVGPAVLDEFVRVVRKGGIVDATVLATIWESGGFKAKVDELKASGRAEVLGDGAVGLRKGETTGGILLLLKKL
ncbi:uncharacterized protein PV09_06471 [Verruconis gallopava]|uniref:Methyltransferase domain-containing protein n=1 Tax=Verruconis gallopava TaxID=253628 RepID=A0A0D1XJ54_9PEZI|nr:uncharacterized protein PV09_06471 [Verruconis gallopava]KIW02326.1 hypothetical protein PV09_06471 [Verruconis gallopava]